GFLKTRLPTLSEQHVYSIEGTHSQVKVVGVYRLILSSGFVLDLNKTFYIPTFDWNLFLVSRLLDSSYKCNLSSGSSNIGNKHCARNKRSSKLWYQRLGNISIERMKRLVKDGVFKALEFTDFDICIDCIKGKRTNKSKKGAKRSIENLEIIHTNIFGQIFTPCLNGEKYFISFIDDHTRYMYVYLLVHKDEALEDFKKYKAEVKKQTGGEGLQFLPLPFPESIAGEPVVHHEENVDEQSGLRRSTRMRKSEISLDYEVYLQQTESDFGTYEDLISFSQAMKSQDSILWYNAMKDEMESMAKNHIWKLVQLPKGSVAIGCK
ncbi:uncharacterized protein LOC122071455, partial [Macadamia integrifolia]|uniref:uncharacterized protein LOC122071455 n=1 Tax=Macadamia integrifolia TaxID=60698 RepID=UPI001C4F414D